jgi:transposase, IS6 family
MILSAIADKLKRRSKDDFKGRHFEASLILQAVSWCLRYPFDVEGPDGRQVTSGAA